jgi:hypothetical protein
MIVFVHLNSPLPQHLILNLTRTLELFPTHDVYLITDDKNKDFSMRNLKVYNYNPNSDWFTVENNLAHPKDFRDNFWFTSLARFIALADFSAMHSGEILHVESDVILSRDFPFHLFTALEASFQFPIVNNELAIASILYLRDFAAATKLRNLVLTESSENSSTTDMHILKILSAIAKNDFALLPTSYCLNNTLVKSSLRFIEENDKACKHFSGVFDGFDLGRYLFGDDPRNNRGISKIRKDDPEVYVDVRKLDFILDDDRDFPYVLNVTNNYKLPIYALHIHCKNSRYFSTVASHKLFLKAIMKSKNKIEYRIYPRILLNSIQTSLIRRLKRVFIKTRRFD